MRPVSASASSYRTLTALLAVAALLQAPGGLARADEPPDDEPQDEGPQDDGAQDEGPADADGGAVVEPTARTPEPAADVRAVVITFDSGFVDAGFAGDDAPRVSERWHLRGGRVTDLAAFETMLRHVYRELGASPAEHPVILSEPFGVPPAERARLTQLMFEKLNVPAFYLAVDGVLACYSAGRKTCLVVTSPDATQALAVYDGYALPATHVVVPVGWTDIAQYAMKLLGARLGHTFASRDREAIARLLEVNGYYAEDFGADRQRAEATTDLAVLVTLPDGQESTLNAERFTAPEAMFKPSLLGLESEGLHAAIFTAIMRCDVDVRPTLYQNVVVAGRALALPGIAERLTQELRQMAPQSTAVKVVAPPERRYSVWIGASILSGLETFKQLWVSKQDYDTSGPSIIQKRAF